MTPNVWYVTKCLKWHIGWGGTWMCIRAQDTLAAGVINLCPSKKMLRQHEQACKEGKRHECEVCHKSYASLSILKQHKKVSHAPECDEVYCCPHCSREYWVKKSMWEHSGVCEQNPDRKGPYFCRVEGCSRAQHPFQKMKNLNHHLDRAHGWREWWEWRQPVTCLWVVVACLHIVYIHIVTWLITWVIT